MLSLLTPPQSTQHALNKCWSCLNFKGVHSGGVDWEVTSDCPSAVQCQSWKSKSLVGKIASLPWILWRPPQSRMSSERCNKETAITPRGSESNCHCCVAVNRSSDAARGNAELASSSLQLMLKYPSLHVWTAVQCHLCSAHGGGEKEEGKGKEGRWKQWKIHRDPALPQTSICVKVAGQSIKAGGGLKGFILLLPGLPDSSG